MAVVTCPIRVYPSTKRIAKRIAKSRRWSSAAVALDEAVKFFEKAHRASAPIGTNGRSQAAEMSAQDGVGAPSSDSPTSETRTNAEAPGTRPGQPNNESASPTKDGPLT